MGSLHSTQFHFTPFGTLGKPIKIIILLYHLGWQYFSIFISTTDALHCICGNTSHNLTFPADDLGKQAIWIPAQT